MPAQGPLFRVGVESSGQVPWGGKWLRPGAPCRIRQMLPWGPQLPGLALVHPEHIPPRPVLPPSLGSWSPALSPSALLLSPPNPLLSGPRVPVPSLSSDPLPLSLLDSGPPTLFVFSTGFPVHGVRGAAPRRTRSTPLPAGPAGGPNLPAPAQTRLRPGKLVGLPSVDTWLTQVQCTAWAPPCGGPAREALAADGRGIGRHGPSPSPWGPTSS